MRKPALICAKWIAFIMISLPLSACQFAQRKIESAVQPEVVAQKAATEISPSPTELPASPPPAPKKTAKQALEEHLLDQAEIAFRGGNFFTPAHNNAYDRFQSVLMLNPNNPQARAGVQAILLRFTGLIRTAITEQRYSSAQNYLEEIELYFPAHPLVMDLKKVIREKLATVYRPREQLMTSEKHLEFEDIRLSGEELTQRSQAIAAALGLIAQRLKATDESILIFARSDREGRWIYKQMKNAVDDYRIRGDIRHSTVPKIRILPPL